jgi:hypothetical protein
MKSFNFNEYKGKELPIEIASGPGKDSSQITAGAEILASCGNIAWGEIRSRNRSEFHCFILDFDQRGKAIGCHVYPHEGFPDKNGNLKPIGNREEAERFFIIQQGFLIDQVKLAEIKNAQKQKLSDLVDEKNKRGLEIRSVRDQLKAEFQKLSEGKSIQEQLNDKDLQSLSAQLSLFNLLYPERKSTK